MPFVLTLRVLAFHIVAPRCSHAGAQPRGADDGGGRNQAQLVQGVTAATENGVDAQLSKGNL